MNRVGKFASARIIRIIDPTMRPREHWLSGSLHARQYLLGLVAMYVLFGGTLISSLHRLNHHSGDFNQLIEDGRLAIDTRSLGETLPLAYPPSARPLFMLMAVGAPSISLVVWWLVHVWLYWQSAVWLSRWISPFGAGWSGALPGFGLIGLSIVGLVSDLSVGQLTGLILFCTVGSYELDRNGRSFTAGVLLAIALLVKPLPAVMLVFFGLRGRWRVLAAAVGAYLVLGPVLLTLLFGWDEMLAGWGWFFETTARWRSPLHVFHRWAEMPGYCLTFRESGLASSLIRLCMDVTYDNNRDSVQMIRLGPGAVRLIWFVLVGIPFAWGCWLVVRRKGAELTWHVFGAMVGLMMLVNPKLISYWLALSMGAIAPLVWRCWMARLAKRWDWLCLIATGIWFTCTLMLGVDVFRAAGGIVVGAYVATIANLIVATRESGSMVSEGGMHRE